MTEKRDAKQALKIFRERMGGLTEAKKAYQKTHRDARKRIGEALKGGPKTVPALAAETGLPGQDVLWHLMAMKRYGELVEVGQAGDYFAYGLKEQDQ